MLFFEKSLIGRRTIYLLIFISYIFISPCLNGNSPKDKTLYKWGSFSDDVDEWKGFGEKDIHPKYKGEVENSKPNGIGVLIYPKGSKYFGEWKDGMMDGQGIFTWSDGTKYSGSWKKGIMSGKGIYMHPNGSKYTGEHKDDKPNGQGTMIYPNGEKCVGEWINGGFPNGTCFYKNGKIQYKYVNGRRIKMSK